MLIRFDLFFLWILHHWIPLLHHTFSFESFQIGWFSQFISFFDSFIVITFIEVMILQIFNSTIPKYQSSFLWFSYDSLNLGHVYSFWRLWLVISFFEQIINRILRLHSGGMIYRRPNVGQISWYSEFVTLHFLPFLIEWCHHFRGDLKVFFCSCHSFLPDRLEHGLLLLKFGLVLEGIRPLRTHQSWHIEWHYLTPLFDGFSRLIIIKMWICSCFFIITGSFWFYAQIRKSILLKVIIIWHVLPWFKWETGLPHWGVEALLALSHFWELRLFSLIGTVKLVEDVLNVLFH